MSILLAALLLFLALGFLGRQCGAVRMLISLVGVLLGLAVAVPLGMKLQPVLVSAGITGSLAGWSWVLAPLLVFLMVQGLFIGLAWYGNHRVTLRHKYRYEGAGFPGWMRLNERLGICVGVFSAGLYFFLLCVAISAGAYLSVQVSSADPAAQPLAVRVLNHAQTDLTALGLDKGVAILDPLPAGYYSTADVLGVLYHNPPLQSRLAAYPALLGLTELPEVQELAKDPQVNEMLLGQPNLPAFLLHPKVQAVFSSSKVLGQLSGLDSRDLMKYLETGVSKYDAEPILGRWSFSINATVGSEARKSTGTVDLRKIKRDLEPLEGTIFMATPAQEAFLKSKSSHTGTWSKQGETYVLELSGATLTVGKTPFAVNRAVVDNGFLQLLASGDRAFYFEKE